MEIVISEKSQVSMVELKMMRVYISNANARYYVKTLNVITSFNGIYYLLLASKIWVTLCIFYTPVCE